MFIENYNIILKKAPAERHISPRWGFIMRLLIISINILPLRGILLIFITQKAKNNFLNLN